MKFSQLFLLSLVSLLLLQCNTTPSGFTIKGQIENAGDITAYFDSKSMDNAIQSITNTPITNNEFTLNIPEGVNPGIYRLRLGAKSIDLPFMVNPIFMLTFISTVYTIVLFKKNSLQTLKKNPI